LYKSMGVPSARISYASLYINEIHWGLYTLLQDIKPRFLEEWFDESDGTLYKCRSGADLHYMGEDSNVYKDWCKEKNNANFCRYELVEASTHYDEFVDLTQFAFALNTTADHNWKKNMEDQFDFESYIRELVVEVSTGNRDGYGANANNYQLYHDTASGKFHYIPFDVDLTWGVSDWSDIDMGNVDIYNWGLTTDEFRGLTTRTIKDSAFHEKFTQYFKRFLQVAFNPLSPLQDRIDALHAMVDPVAREDIMHLFDKGFTYGDFAASLAQPIVHYNPQTKTNVTIVPYGLHNYLATRYASAISQLH